MVDHWFDMAEFKQSSTSSHGWHQTKVGLKPRLSIVDNGWHFLGAVDFNAPWLNMVDFSA